MPEEVPTIKPRMKPPKVPGRNLPFVVRHEAWSKYEVAGGAIEVWVRNVALRIHETTKDGEAGPAFKAGTPVVAGAALVNVFADEAHKGEPEAEPPSAGEIERKGVAIDFRPTTEPENVYFVPGKPDRILTTRMIMTRARLVAGRFDPNGEPFITVDHTVATSFFRPARVDELGA